MITQDDVDHLRYWYNRLLRLSQPAIRTDMVKFNEIINKLHKEVNEPKTAKGEDQPKSQVNHPSHYGGEDNPYEAIKIIEAHDLNFSMGNVIKYALRAGKKENNTAIQDLEKAKWYLEREIKRLG